MRRNLDNSDITLSAWLSAIPKLYKGYVLVQFTSTRLVEHSNGGRVKWWLVVTALSIREAFNDDCTQCFKDSSLFSYEM